MSEEGNEREAGLGATGIFGVVPAAPADTGRGVSADSASSQPVVHTVIFRADSSRMEETDELLDLLRLPSAPLVEARPVASSLPAAVPANGGFTQLVQSLNHEQV